MMERRFLKSEEDRLRARIAELEELLDHGVTRVIDIEPAVMSLAAAAKFLGFGTAKLIRLTNEGVIPCYDSDSRRIYRTEDLKKYLAGILQKKWTPHLIKVKNFQHKE